MFQRPPAGRRTSRAGALSENELAASLVGFERLFDPAGHAGAVSLRAAEAAFLDPQLPDWLPELKIENLQVGNASCSIRFYRKHKTTHFDVVDKRGKLRILRQPSPWSLTATVVERIEDLIESLMQ